jgi:hypothetical protein
MGVSTDGIIFYGYVWDDEFTLLEDVDGEGWARIVAEKRGHTDPWDGFAEGEEDWVSTHQAELDGWRAVRKSIEEEFGVDIRHHGSGEWQCPYILVNDSRREAARGYPQELQVGTTVYGPPAGWDEKLLRFVDELEINLEEAQGPAWWLVSYWG